MLAAAHVLLLALLSISSNAHAQAAYAIAVDVAHPHELAATLRLSPGKARRVFLRGTAWGLASQVVDPRCDDRPLEPSGKDVWSVPDDCRQIRWTIAARAARDGEVDASAQATIAFQDRPLWLISEATSLLRIDGSDGAASLAINAPQRLHQLGATRLDDTRWRVPSLQHAPEFYVVGTFATRTRMIGPFRVRYVADAPVRVERLHLEPMHERVLRRLAAILPPGSTRPLRDRTLLVVWLGIDATARRSGGAAGNRSFIANYAFGASTSQSDQARTLMTLAHEQFHQLVDMARGDRLPLPTWFNESIATYCGLEAVASATPRAAVAKLRDELIDSARPNATGLLALQRRYEAGDSSVYPLFYSQGATFWHEVDKALRASGSSLDALLPALVTGAFGPDGALPESFIDALRARLGSAATGILDRYY